MRTNGDYFTRLYSETAIMIRGTSPALLLPFIMLFIPSVVAILLTFGACLIFSGYLVILLESYLYNRELSRQCYIAALDIAEAKARKKSPSLPQDDHDNYADIIRKIANNTYLNNAYIDDKLDVDYTISDSVDKEQLNNELKLLYDGGLHKSYPAGLKAYVTSDDFKISRIFALAVVKRIMIFLGLVCFIVPGLLMAINYSMSSFVLVDYPDIKSPFVILSKSKAVISGHRKDLLRLTATFALPVLTSILSLGLLLPWTLPFIKLLKARFYHQLMHPDGIEPPPYIL